jgi:hypothetical protein
MGTETKGALDSAAQQTKKVFYVLRRGYRNRYVSAALSGPYRETLQEAQRFDSVNDAMLRIPTMGVVESSLEIVRVEEITTPGTKRRVEVPLGDKRQTHIAIRSRAAGWYFSDITAADQKNLLNEALVFPTLNAALEAYGGANRDEKRFAYTPHSVEFVGIAEESLPGTTTYTETVLA